MDLLTLYGIAALGFMLLCYVVEERAAVWTLLFAFGCALSAGYGFAQGAWPFGVVEVIWTGAALRRWRQRLASGTDRLT